MGLIQEYRAHTEERAASGIPPLPLTAEQTRELIELLQQDPVAEQDYLLELFCEHISPGVDDAAFEKAAFLDSIVKGEKAFSALSAVEAVTILGTMLGGYNVQPLVDALSNENSDVAAAGADKREETLLVYGIFGVVAETAKKDSYANEGSASSG
ncbi:MAG: aconitate hydratase B, partial [Chlorobium phaeobacteroides]|nr:aconitate hydratase B [Chlorobium phaeobacteroides]